MVARLRFILENHGAVGLPAFQETEVHRHATRCPVRHAAHVPILTGLFGHHDVLAQTGIERKGLVPHRRNFRQVIQNVGIFVIFRRRVAQVTDPMVEYDIHGQDMRTRPHIHRRDAVPVTRLELFGRHVAHAARRVIFRSGQ